MLQYESEITVSSYVLPVQLMMILAGDDQTLSTSICFRFAHYQPSCMHGLDEYGTYQLYKGILAHVIHY